MQHDSMESRPCVNKNVGLGDVLPPFLVCLRVEHTRKENIMGWKTDTGVVGCLWLLCAVVQIAFWCGMVWLAVTIAKAVWFS